MLYEKIKKFWTIRPKIVLKHNKRWNGEVITPMKSDRSKKVIIPQYKQKIVRKFGDKLIDEE